MYFFEIFSFYVSQVRNSHKISIGVDRIMLQIVQSSLGIQIGFYNKTLITQRAQTCLKLNSTNRGHTSLKRVEGDLKPCRADAVKLESWNPG